MMSPNVLVTGAAGYIGGAIIADFQARNLVKRENLIATVRSEEQVNALSKLGITVLQLDLTDEIAVVETLKTHNITIAINTASCLDSRPALNLITGLSKQQQMSGKETYFIHTSGLGAYVEMTGWPAGEYYESGPIFELEKEIANSFAIRKTNVDAIELSKALGITSFTVVPSIVYGKGSGEWNKLSVVLPPVVLASITDKTVHKFSEDLRVSCVHITDITALFSLIVEKIIKKEALPNGEKGYYFAIGHRAKMWEVMDRLAAALRARNLVTDTKTPIWPSNEAAGAAYGAPADFVAALWNSSDNIIIPENGIKIGWKPKWDEKRFLDNINDEIDAVVENGKAKSRLMDSLFVASRG